MHSRLQGVMAALIATNIIASSNAAGSIQEVAHLQFCGWSIRGAEMPGGGLGRSEGRGQDASASGQQATVYLSQPQTNLRELQTCHKPCGLALRARSSCPANTADMVICSCFCYTALPNFLLLLKW